MQCVTLVTYDVPPHSRIDHCKILLQRPAEKAFAKPYGDVILSCLHSGMEHPLFMIQ